MIPEELEEAPQRHTDLARDIREAGEGALLLAGLGFVLGVLYAAWRLNPKRKK